MRQLGSFFHIAMNGMAASDKIFKLLELPEPGNAGVENAHADEKMHRPALKSHAGMGISSAMTFIIHTRRTERFFMASM